MANVFTDTIHYVNQLTFENNAIENFVQGTQWKHQIMGDQKLILPLFIYYDDFEPCNVLSSHSGEQKLGAVYASIPCIPPQYQSLLENLFLAI